VRILCDLVCVNFKGAVAAEMTDATATTFTLLLLYGGEYIRPLGTCDHLTGLCWSVIVRPAALLPLCKGALVLLCLLQLPQEASAPPAPPSAPPSGANSAPKPASTPPLVFPSAPLGPPTHPEAACAAAPSALSPGHLHQHQVVAPPA